MASLKVLGNINGPMENIMRDNGLADFGMVLECGKEQRETAM